MGAGASRMVGGFSGSSSHLNGTDFVSNFSTNELPPRYDIMAFSSAGRENCGLTDFSARN